MKSKTNIEQFLSSPQLQKQPAKGYAVESLFSFGKMTEQEKAKFCLELSVMLQAGVSLHRALQVLSDQADKQASKTVLSQLLKEVQKGVSFSSALRQQAETFDNLFVVSAEVGQESGKLPLVMSNLALHLEKINVLKRKFVQALAYPIMVLCVALFAVLFLLIVIVPAFAEMFLSLQVELPPMTKIILSLSHWLTENGLYLLLAVIIAGIALRSVFASTSVKSKIENTAYRLPFIGKILSKNLVARFCRTLGTLLQAQVSLMTALDITQKIFTAETIRKEIQNILKQVKQGKTIAEPIVTSKVFPAMVSQMIAVGEETSELDLMLFKIAEYSEKEIDATVETLSNIIEPVLILLLGIIVAAILISMYMPMFEMMNVIG